MSNRQAHPDTEAIWRMLSDRLRQFIRSRVASTADVDDILQSVFLRIHQHLNKLQQAERLEAWVFQIARNSIADHYRQSRRNQPEVDEAPAFVSQGSDNLIAEVAGCLNGMIDRLPADLQRAVSMYEREGISQKEIATRELISLSGAKSRVQRGRKLLTKMLEDCCQLQFDLFGNVLHWNPVQSPTQVHEACACEHCDD